MKLSEETTTAPTGPRCVRNALSMLLPPEAAIFIPFSRASARPRIRRKRVGFRCNALRDCVDTFPGRQFHSSPPPPRQDSLRRFTFFRPESWPRTFALGTALINDRTSPTRRRIMRKGCFEYFPPRGIQGASIKRVTQQRLPEEIFRSNGIP